MSALSDKVIAISKPYFGPATEKFLIRQCAHLNIEVTAIEPSHLPKLAEWVNRSGKMIMDPAKASEVADKIARL
jgi:hypothetical protein